MIPSSPSLTSLLDLLAHRQASGWWLSLVAHEATDDRPGHWSARLEKEGWKTVVVEAGTMAEALALVLEVTPRAAVPSGRESA